MVSDFIEEVCTAQRSQLVGDVEGLQLGRFSAVVLGNDFRRLGMDPQLTLPPHLRPHPYPPCLCYVIASTRQAEPVVILFSGI